MLRRGLAFTYTNSAKLGTTVIRPKGTEPALGVQGVGTGTKLTADDSLDDGARLITTEAFGIALSQVVEPTVRDVYLDGNQNFTERPSGDDPPVCHAIAIDGDAAEVTGCKVFDFAGDAIRVNNSLAEAQPLVRMPRVRDNKISLCYSGIVAAAVDTQIDGNRVANVRDFGIRAIAGAIQCSNNHAYGATVGIQFEGGPSRSIGDRFSDCPTGFKVLSGASGSHIADGTTEHCWEKNMLVQGERVRIANTRILVANTSQQHPGQNNDGITSIVGLHLDHQAIQSLVSDCDVEVGIYTFPNDTNLTGSTGVLVGASNVVIDNLKIFGNLNIPNEIGVRVAADRDGGDFFIDARGGGFRENTNDRVVKFDANDCTGMVWYILHDPLDEPVEIPSGWGSSLKIFTRASDASDWTQLTTGNAYP